MDFFGSFHGQKAVKNGVFWHSDGLFWVISPHFPKFQKSKKFQRINPVHEKY